jgi:hypothetical protein
MKLTETKEVILHLFALFPNFRHKVDELKKKHAGDARVQLAMWRESLETLDKNYCISACKELRQMHEDDRPKAYFDYPFWVANRAKEKQLKQEREIERFKSFVNHHNDKYNDRWDRYKCHNCSDTGFRLVVHPKSIREASRVKGESAEFERRKYGQLCVACSCEAGERRRCGRFLASMIAVDSTDIDEMIDKVCRLYKEKQDATA